ncbi:hypothetical protein DTO96_100013 [Ephemeroptericola cinctiostellae]|uniref:DUF2889 domain-containing protein n=1 Tax=Ephemeroptericola cinctiostellae TaxID=2268024 RepID=A0A345D7H8_9BURK|nr:DUF2889 domain-containing protein [Ephemeroptericola cinctiostellae]AXF84316.1 hypothetical protein DTO96_100013 [Ephemeroptericola cinctiostellae]
MEQNNPIFEPLIKGLGEPVSRTIMHRRTFCFEVFEREDGLWDVDAQMQDHKMQDITLADELRPVGAALHDMVMRVTFDNTLTVVAVEDKTLAAPYMLQCKTINSAYGKMIGLNVLKGFRAAMKERFADTAGCTHLTELANIMPTVVVQGIGTELARRARMLEKDDGTPSKKPFQLDKCHALSSDSEVARLYYPKWYSSALNTEVST